MDGDLSSSRGGGGRALFSGLMDESGVLVGAVLGFVGVTGGLLEALLLVKPDRRRAIDLPMESIL